MKITDVQVPGTKLVSLLKLAEKSGVKIADVHGSIYNEFGHPASFIVHSIIFEDGSIAKVGEDPLEINIELVAEKMYGDDDELFGSIS